MGEYYKKFKILIYRKFTNLKDESNNIKKFFEKFKDFDANIPLNPVFF